MYLYSGHSMMPKLCCVMYHYVCMKQIECILTAGIVFLLISHIAKYIYTHTQVDDFSAPTADAMGRQ